MTPTITTIRIPLMMLTAGRLLLLWEHERWVAQRRGAG